MTIKNKNVLIFAIHRTENWWRFIGNNLGCASSIVATDIRGKGDISIVDDFYNGMKYFRDNPNVNFNLLDEEQIADIISRCRLLRWLNHNQAVLMIKGMASAIDKLLDHVKPDIVLSLPIDRYPTDILDHLARARGIPYVQLTASVFPRMSMLLKRGNLILSSAEPDEESIKKGISDLTATTFVPSYVPRKSTYTATRFLSILGYFRTRALAFKIISILKRDPLNLHYLDAQPNLGHKCEWRDIRIVNLVDYNWRNKLQEFPKSKRILFGLQLFPEASIDYWIEPLELIEHEKLVIEAAEAFSNAGFLVLVKDHPLQFGFRKTDFLDAILNLHNTVLVPYNVPGQELLNLVDVNFTCTGTLGLQAALLGKTSLVTDSYYTNDQDFLIFKERNDLKKLPQKAINDQSALHNIPERNERIVRQLLKGSFNGDIFTFQKFNPSNPSREAFELARALGRRLNEISES